jgi:hypothetical protein
MMADKKLKDRYVVEGKVKNYWMKQEIVDIRSRKIIESKIQKLELARQKLIDENKKNWDAMESHGGWINFGADTKEIDIRLDELHNLLKKPKGDE